MKKLSCLLVLILASLTIVTPVLAIDTQEICYDQNHVHEEGELFYDPAHEGEVIDAPNLDGVWISPFYVKCSPDATGPHNSKLIKIGVVKASNPPKYQYVCYFCRSGPIIYY